MEIIEKDDLTAVLFIDGVKVEGQIVEDKRCKSCNQIIVHHYRYDAYFCPECNEWLENQCPDEYCRYCKDRPNKPL